MSKLRTLKRSVLLGLLFAPSTGCQLPNGLPKPSVPFADSFSQNEAETSDIMLDAKAPPVGESAIENMTRRIMARTGKAPAQPVSKPKTIRYQAKASQRPAQPQQDARPRVEQVQFSEATTVSEGPEVMVINGRTYRLEPETSKPRALTNHLRPATVAPAPRVQAISTRSEEVRETSALPDAWQAKAQPAGTLRPPVPYEVPTSVITAPTAVQEIAPVYEVETSQPDAMQLDLTTALAMVGGSHPAIGLAQWRVRESQARYEQARHLWLPNIRAGVSFHRHDGNYQASNGSIVDVNRTSLQAGLGAGGVGAGTTPRQGVSAEFHVADAIFQSRVEQRRTWASGHAATAATNDQMLEVAIAYLSLVSAEQRLAVLQVSADKMRGLAKLTQDFAETGLGLKSDAQRVQTEVAMTSARLSEAQEGIDIASTRLVKALSYDATQNIRSSEMTLIPLDLVSLDIDRRSLISTGLMNRPELKESQCLVAAACERYKREKAASYLPSILLGLSHTGFGGGVGTTASNWDQRFDFDAMMTWELRGLGINEKHIRNQTSAQVQQRRFQKAAMLDQVASQIAETHAQAIRRRERVALSETAISTAEDSYQRNLERIKGGEGLPIEVLQSITALENAQMVYLKAVADFNEAQFRLQRAMGWPVEALPDSTPTQI